MPTCLPAPRTHPESARRRERPEDGPQAGPRVLHRHIAIGESRQDFDASRPLEQNRLATKRTCINARPVQSREIRLLRYPPHVDSQAHRWMNVGLREDGLPLVGIRLPQPGNPPARVVPAAGVARANFLQQHARFAKKGSQNRVDKSLYPCKPEQGCRFDRLMHDRMHGARLAVCVRHEFAERYVKERAHGRIGCRTIQQRFSEGIDDAIGPQCVERQILRCRTQRSGLASRLGKRFGGTRTPEYPSNHARGKREGLSKRVRMIGTRRICGHRTQVPSRRPKIVPQGNGLPRRTSTTGRRRPPAR